MSNEHYAFIPEHTIQDPSFRKLRPNSRLLFVYLVAKSKGYSEAFSYSYKEIRKDSRMGYQTISACIKELAKEGFIEYKHGGLELNYNNYTIPAYWLERH